MKYKKQINSIVVGSGFGGIASALRLRSLGHNVTIIEKLNKIGGANGIGRVDLVENRFIGIKSRGVYETPGGTILYFAHRAIESVTLDKATMHAKERIMPLYAELVYNGYWFSKKRLSLQKIIDKKRNQVNGEVILKIYKGNIYFFHELMLISYQMLF